MTKEKVKRAPTGFRAFLIVVVGQLFSLTGTGMSRFALTLFAWESTQQATSVALIGFFSFAPVIVMSPIAGALVDRWNRKLMMMLSDFGAGVATIALFLLSLSGQLELWHVYIAALVTGVFESFQFPAYSAAISLMIDKKDYGRANGLVGVVESSSGILAPVFAASVYVLVGLNGILLIDLITLVIAFITLLIVHIPQPPPSDQDTAHTSLLEDSLFGFKYIKAHPSLFGLQLFFFFGNFLFGAGALVAPMILARTGNDANMLALVNALQGIGGVVGGVIITWWGGFHRRIYGVFIGWIVPASMGLIAMGLARDAVSWGIAGFMTVAVFQLLNASNQGIWMSKIPPALQGRVFSIRRLIAQVAGPLAILVVGPLADNVFEPNMAVGGAWAATFGSWVGVGAGAGMGLILVFCGGLLMVTTLVLFSVPGIRNVERIVPDHDTSNPKLETFAEATP